MQFNWNEITSLAYMSLIELNYTSFPIPPNRIKCKGARIISYQKYAKKTGVAIEEITCGHELDDAYAIRELRPGVDLILYNKDKHENRMKHTLWHEVGHIKCNHKEHGEKEEIEAHFFAAQANAPNILIRTIARRGYAINKAFLVDCFGLSEESANKKMGYLSKYGFEHTNECDEYVLALFLDYINSKYPVRTKHFYDDYFDNLEDERKTWY